MLMDLILKTTQEQKLIMTQQMQLSIQLLQMSNYDLREYIEKEFLENPILEVKYEQSQEDKENKHRIDYKELIKYLESDNYGSQSYGEYSDESISPFTFISKPKSFTEYLKEQVLELPIDNYLKSVCQYMIESLDERGYLEINVCELQKEINCSSETIKKSLIVLHNLEPAGIGAKNLKECLLLQLKRKGAIDLIAEKIVNNYLEDLADNKYQKIAKELEITPKEAQKYGDLIKSLEPKPSRGFYTGEEVKYIIPEAEIRKIDGEFFIIMKDNLIPKLSVNCEYNNILKNNNDEKATKYVKEKMERAIFLIKSVEQRKNTLYKVLEKIVEKQIEYFKKGEKYLKPMTLKEIAEEIKVHESTVSRAIKEKYILCSFGTIKIKDLFTNGIHIKTSTEGINEDITVINIKKYIENFISEENKLKPLSDQIICDKLQGKGMVISRRTVAKYREEMGIKSSSKRKRF